MGNCNSVSSSSEDGDFPGEKSFQNQELPPIPGLPAELFVDRAKTEAEGLRDVEEALKDFKESNLERMRGEIKKDLNTFILNNLLLSVQFFENFESSLEAAKSFKYEKEKEMNGHLAGVAQDGVILGERRVAMVHGMGHELAKYVVYKPSTNSIDDFDTIYSSTNKDINHTFMTNGILPLEFYLSWDNLEIFKESDWDSLQNSEYSNTEATNLRFCMEEPSNENKIPKGYARFRCMDIPLTLSSKLAQFTPKGGSKDQPLSVENGNYDYATGSLYDLRSEEIPESDSEQNNSGHSSDSSSKSSQVSVAMSNISEMNFLEKVKKSPGIGMFKKGPNEAAGSSQPFYQKPDMTKKTNLLKTKRLSFSDPNIPQVIIDSPTPGLGADKSPDWPVYNQGRRDSGVRPQNHVGLFIKKVHPSLEERRKAKSYPKLPLLPNDHDQELVRISNTSSGYETISQRSVFTVTSSAVSEEIRERWREIEIKQLWEYPNKSRQNALFQPAQPAKKSTTRPEPLSSECFLPVQIEASSDEEDGDSDDSDASFNSETDSIDSRGRIIKPLQPKYRVRTYLNSSIFSSDFCSEFRVIGNKLGLPGGTISQATVFGTTVRLSVSQSNSKKSDDVHDILYMFTPSLRSEFWPQKSLIWWKQRMRDNAIKKDKIEGLVWPKPIEVDSISELGCHASPLGFRKIEVFNKFQSIEWQINFPHAETLLLNSFKSVHWRCYIISSILFRAFIAPLGPLGVDLSHFRNILYFMCEEEFVTWKDEEPGNQLKSLLTRLYNCLAKEKMSHFFNKSRNVLSSVPAQNILKVQAYLHRIRVNLVVYCIYAFRNLHTVQPQGKYYPTPDLVELYKLITVDNESDLFYLLSPFLKAPAPTLTKSQSKANNRKKYVARNRRRVRPKNFKKKEKDTDDEDLEFRKTGDKPKSLDKYQTRQKRKFKRHQRELDKQRQEEEERRKLEEEAKEIIPVKERRRSIDLDVDPVKPQKFSNLRLVLVIDFFIRHFIQMAAKSFDFKTYAQATMYVHQVENLCEILSGMNLDKTPLNEYKIKNYMKEIAEIKDLIGINKKEYVLSKISHLDLPGGQDKFLGLDLANIHEKVAGESISNWEMRKLPTPPISRQGSISSFNGGKFSGNSWGSNHKFPMIGKMNKLPRAYIAKTLQSIPMDENSSRSFQASRRESINLLFLNDSLFKSGQQRQKVRVPSVLNEETESIDESNSNFSLKENKGILNHTRRTQKSSDINSNFSFQSNFQIQESGLL